jgi:hypothetical protein
VYLQYISARDQCIHPSDRDSVSIFLKGISVSIPLTWIIVSVPLTGMCIHCIYWVENIHPRYENAEYYSRVTVPIPLAGISTYNMKSIFIPCAGTGYPSRALGAVYPHFVRRTVYPPPCFHDFIRRIGVSLCFVRGEGG